MLTRLETDPAYFEAHKLLDESEGESLLIKENGNRSTAILLLKITPMAKIKLIN